MNTFILVLSTGKAYNHNMTKIITDSKIMLGKPTVAGTRITVEQVLKLLAQKLNVEDILKDFPQLKEADIKAAVEFAAKRVSKVEPQAISYLHEIHHR
ncbi:MAG: DUF433 domain-containing protein [Candidatus Daviesbacteria bacterium]|nr:DUF433 domain-containing protein [Candidatus Daviesbacteria bacterium]